MGADFLRDCLPLDFRKSEMKMRPLHARSLRAQVKTRAFGMTQSEGVGFRGMASRAGCLRHTSIPEMGISADFVGDCLPEKFRKS